MDSPLYGDENNKIWRILWWGIVIFVGASVLITCGILIVMAFLPGIGHWQHIAFAVLILVVLLPEFIFLYWQKFSYMEPKMKVIMFMIAFATIIACVVSLMYAFGLNYPGKQCTGNNFFRRGDGKCFNAISGSDCFQQPNKCIAWRNDIPYCGNFNSTTRICTA